MAKRFPEITFTLTGKPAWIAVLILLVLFGLQHGCMRATVAQGSVECIQPWVVADYGRLALRDVQGKLPDQLSKAEVDALADKVSAAQCVDVQFLKARGLGSNVVVKVKITVDGKTPPDGKDIRYYRVNYSYLFGWTYDQEVGPLSYWLLWG